MDRQGAPPFYDQRTDKPPMGGGAAASKKASMFPPPQWRDLWAAIAFYLHLGGLAALAVYIFQSASALNSQHDATPIDPAAIRYLLICLSGGIITAIGLTALVLMGMYRKPEPMIHAAFLGSAAFYLALGIYLFAPVGGFAGLFPVLLAGLHILLYFIWKSRIPFTAILVRTVVSGLGQHPSMFLVSVGAVITTVLYLALFGLMGSAIAMIYDRGPKEHGALNAISLYTVFSFYWTSQVIANVSQTTFAGVYATFYFLHGTGQTIVNPTGGSLRRALTYSFGSICFGSLIVALIQTLRYLLRSLFSRDSIAGAIVDCIVGVLESLAAMFNSYAYTQIAIYGKPYIEAAKDTWALIKSRGIDAIANEALVGTCLGLWAFVIAIMSGTVASAMSFFIYSYHGAIALATGILVALCCLIIPFVAFDIIDAGVRTVFVCLAEDPTSLQRTNPELYGEISRRYAQVTI